MIFDIPYNLIAEFPRANYQTIDEVLPYKQYSAGARDRDKPVYAIPVDSSSNPVLILDFDILNEYGFGLKRGYYEIAVSPDYDYLMFIQSNTIKAKIPVIKQELINEYGSNFEWDDDKDKAAPQAGSKSLTDEIQVSSKKILTRKFSEKELKKRKKKYKKGKDPALYFHSAVYMEYDKELSLYKIIWEKYNTRIIGILKLK